MTKQYSEKTLSYWQLASVVVNEGDEACTTNLCQTCFNKHLQAKGEEPLSNVKWRQVVEKEAYRGRMWKMMGKKPCLRGMWEHFSSERSKAKEFRQLADEEKQAGIQGQWQQESPAREYLEQVQRCHDTDCNESRMKKGFTAFKIETRKEYKETFRKKMKASEWAFDRMKEAIDSAAQDEARKVSVVQEIMFKSTDYLRRIIATVGGQGGVTMSYLCPNCNSFPLEDCVWWVSGVKTTRWWCAICGEKYDWRQPNRLLVVQTGESFETRMRYTRACAQT